MEINPEEEEVFLRAKTGCTADEAWNYMIAGDSFFDENPGDDTSEENLVQFICEASGMSEQLARRLMDAETEFFVSKGML